MLTYLSQYLLCVWLLIGLRSPYKWKQTTYCVYTISLTSITEPIHYFHIVSGWILSLFPSSTAPAAKFIQHNTIWIDKIRLSLAVSKRLRTRLVCSRISLALSFHHPQRPQGCFRFSSLKTGVALSLTCSSFTAYLPSNCCLLAITIKENNHNKIFNEKGRQSREVFNVHAINDD